MKTKLSLFALAFMALGPLCTAQTNPPADDWKPATSNQPGKQHPQVNSQGCVRALPPRLIIVPVPGDSAP